MSESDLNLTRHNHNVHVIDDDQAVLDAISLLLDSVGINNICYHDAQQFLDAYTSPEFDKTSGCIVMDIRMPLMSGIECHFRLLELGNALPILFVTGHGDIPMAVEAMKRGAVEFIQKPFREQELIDAIQRALELNNREIQHQLYISDVSARVDTLSDREKEVLKLLIEGKANKVIAIELHLSQRTVEIHRANVMDKMRADTLAHLIKMSLLVEQQKNR